MASNETKFRISWANLIFFALLALLIIPNTRKPISVFVNRIIAFSPSSIKEDKRQVIEGFDYRLRSLSGNPTSIPVGKGRVVLINYWATWCAPCIAEMPSLQNLYNELGDEMDFVFITSEDEAIVRKFMERHNYQLPVYSPLMAAPKLLYDNQIPTTFLVDGDGKIVIKKTGAANWDSTKTKDLIRELL